MRRELIIFTLCWIVCVFCCANRLVADAIILQDGSRIEGEVRRTDTGWTVTSTDGKSKDIPANDVKTIEVAGSGKPNETAAASNLASLRRSSDALGNPQQVLERYRRFLDQNKGTPSIDDARRDMAIWQDRSDRGLVRVGTRWVTREQKSQMASDASTVARQAVDLLKQGRTNEAEPIVQQALDADPQNPAALYLHGLTLFAQQQIVAARHAFEAVIAQLPDHSPSFNNLGVILWKQNQQMGAMKFYEQGMIASPISKVVLDNVAEALAALPEDQRRNPLAIRVFKTFAEQDAQLQTIMAQTGWHRWGSTWVDQPTLDKLKLAEQAVNDKLAKIDADITTAKGKIADIDASIDGNTQSMNQMQANSMVRDAKGNYYQAPLPSIYYTLQSNNEKLTGDRAAQQAKIQSLLEDVKKAQQSMPVPQYTGVQRMISVEGTPFPPATAPSTQAATAPATAPAFTPVMMPLP